MQPPFASPCDAVLDRLHEAAALLLWEYEAVRVRADEPFRLASGNHSPIYVDCRRLISEPVFMQLFIAAARAIWQRHNLVVEVVAGGETAGIPFAAWLASSFGLSMVYVRKKAKRYGIASRLEGHLEKGAKVLLVEDLITDAGSKLGFLDAIAAAGGEVHDVLVVFDRQQGGAETLAHRRVRLHAVTDRATTLEVGAAIGLLPEADRQSVDEYFRDAAAWHRERGLIYEDTQGWQL